jgi:nucleotide-binding universal stress UspA family protein
MNEHGVVVGVTMGGDDTAVLRFAADEAARTGAIVTLVHASYLPLPPLPPSPMQTSLPALDVGRAVVRAAAQRYKELTGEKCRTLAEEGPPAVVLVRLSETADLIVLGHRHMSAVRRIVTRSTAFTVAAHAHCPVVTVPTASILSSEADEVVTLGAHEKSVPEALLRAALDVASRRHARLRVIHAWRLDPEYDDIVSGRVGGEWTAKVEEELLKAARRLADEFPKVVVDAEVLHQWPANALVEASRTSSVLVVGRHQTLPHLPMRLGSMTRTVLDRAEGPVMVVPT